MEYSSYKKWYYHLTLDSLGERNLLNSLDQCVNAMNVIAIGQFLYDVDVVQFDWMRNHGHLVLYATGLQCCELFAYIKKRINSKLVEDGYPPLPSDWYMNLRKLETITDLINAVTYSGRNSFDARGDILPSGYLWSSNYLLFSDINMLFEYRTLSEVSLTEARRLLGSRVILPSDYKISRLGYILPESYIMRTPDGKMTKAQSLYKDSKDYAYRMFRDFNTYRRMAADIGESWSPSGGDVDSLIDSLLNYGYGVGGVGDLPMDKRYELATRLSFAYGVEAEAVAEKLKVSQAAVSKMVYSHNKRNH